MRNEHNQTFGIPANNGKPTEHSSEAAANLARHKVATSLADKNADIPTYLNPYQNNQQTTEPNHQKTIGPANQEDRTLAQIKAELLKKIEQDSVEKKTRLKPLVTAIIASLVFAFFNWNQLIIAQTKQYISPGSTLSTPIIIDPSENYKVGPEPRIIIPKINVDAPVVYDVKTYDERKIQEALANGVVHYGNTALPGQKGNNVIVGHSSNDFLNSGKYKFVFVLLERLEVGDTFMLNYEGKRYIYKVFNKQIVQPTDFSLVQPTDEPITTLITCTPPGTSWRRLIVQARQISPDPNQAEKVDQPTQTPQAPLPSDGPGLWGRITSLFD